ncbi:hypothetical protein G7Y89_g11936 [Cudoniella acicularis]|uniref:Uncharacterized protein n=1 Tax=Cudoniella acicularis TaxID=354080 RepID=A0A8H4RDL1_9HELO|nr:hypothetical protein G7Y89_g11936 [Cudoniella acicularis]
MDKQLPTTLLHIGGWCEMSNLFSYPLPYSLCALSFQPDVPNHSLRSDEHLDYSQASHQPVFVTDSPVHKQHQRLLKSTVKRGLVVERWLQEWAGDLPWSMTEHVQEVDLFSRPFSDPANCYLVASDNDATAGNSSSDDYRFEIKEFHACQEPYWTS